MILAAMRMPIVSICLKFQPEGSFLKLWFVPLGEVIFHSPWNTISSIAVPLTSPPSPSHPEMGGVFVILPSYKFGGDSIK